MASSKWPASEILTKHRGTCTIHSGWHEFTSRPTDWLSWFTVFVAIQFSSQKLAAVTFFYTLPFTLHIRKPTDHRFTTQCFSRCTVCLPLARKPPNGPGPPRSRGFQITHNDAPQSVRLLWTSDQPVAETSTSQHTTLTTDRHPCPRWDSNPQLSAGERPQTYALDRAATGIGSVHCTEL